MRVIEASSLQLEWIESTASVRQVADRMKARDVGLLLVGLDERLMGVVTDRDVAIRALAGSRPVSELTAADIMSQPAVCVDGDADIDDAARLMAERRVRRLVVLDARSLPVGVLSLDDIAFFTRGDGTAGQVLEELAHGPVGRPLIRSG